MALFLDTFVNKLDRKGRVSVPAPYRQQLASNGFQGIAALPSSSTARSNAAASNGSTRSTVSWAAWISSPTSMTI
jgi:Uncharacterized protein conserved in bacteria